MTEPTDEQIMAHVTPFTVDDYEAIIHMDRIAQYRYMKTLRDRNEQFIAQRAAIRRMETEHAQAIAALTAERDAALAERDELKRAVERLENEPVKAEADIERFKAVDADIVRVESVETPYAYAVGEEAAEEAIPRLSSAGRHGSKSRPEKRVS